jgi:hypothetical protein
MLTGWVRLDPSERLFSGRQTYQCMELSTFGLPEQLEGYEDSEDRNTDKAQPRKKMTQ